jgi:hypothetical protein
MPSAITQVSRRAARPAPACDSAARATAATASSAIEPQKASSGSRPKPPSVVAPAAKSPEKTAAIAAVQISRGRSRAVRSTGALSSQDPTAGETNTGPNNRATASTTASTVSAVSQGRTGAG